MSSVTLTLTPRRLPLCALLCASAVSLIGDTLTLIALPWFVLQTTGSPALTGLAGFFSSLPGLSAGLFGGTLVDRFGYKRTSIVADLVSCVGIVLVPLLYFFGILAFWQLLGSIFLGALLQVPGLTARRSMLPELARAAGVRLEQANSWFESLQSLSWLLGPPLAGLLIAWIGVTNVLWLDAASFGISALLVGMLIPALLIVTPPTSHGRYRDELVAGLRFLWNDRLLRALAVGLALTNAMFNPLFAVILPVYTRSTTGSATELGLLLTAEGSGALIGALLFGVIGHRLPRRATWIGAFIINALPFWMLVFAPSLPVLMSTLFIAGVVGGPLNPLLVTIRHERVPLALRGRVFGTFSAISMAVTPLGIVLAGYLIEATSWHTTVLALAICYQTVGLSMLFVRAFHQMKRVGHETA